MKKEIEEISKLCEEKFEKEIKKMKVKEIEEVKEYLDDKYYNTGEFSGLSDEQYDKLVEILENKTKKPNKKVGVKMREGENRVKLPIYLGSIDKIRIKEDNKLKNWLNKNESESYIIESKLDGVSCLLTNEDGEIRLYTRGDGKIGADITHLTKYIKNIPKKLEEDINIRGELIINEKVFYEKYQESFTNPRNMISGLVNSKTLREGVNDIEFIAYELIYNNMSEKQERPEKQLEILRNNGFKIVYNKIINDINFEVLTEEYLYSKQISEYEIDGMIIQGNKGYIRNIKDNPKYAFAYKMTLDTNLIEADVEEVEWNISKYKLLKPRIRIKPVHLNGVTITYTSGFNAKYIVENNIGKGTKLLMTRSGDVIPFIVKIIKASKSPDMPKMSYSWNTNKVDIKVDEDEDNVSDIKLLTSFFAGIGIKNVSNATVTKIFNAGYTSLLDILKASKEDFEEIDGFGKTLAEKVYNNIHNGLQNTTMDGLLGSCGMLGENIGSRKIKLLLDNIPDLFKIYKKMSEAELIDRINNIKGFSDITTLKIVENIEKADIFLTSISKYVSFEKKERKDNEFENMKFLFSGFRDKDLEKIIIQKGGTIVTSISKNTSVLIVKDVEEKSSKIQKAKELNIPVIARDKFI